jgi:hypothetical protein
LFFGGWEKLVYNLKYRPMVNSAENRFQALIDRNQYRTYPSQPKKLPF